MDYYLKTETEESLEAVLVEAGIARVDENGMFTIDPAYALVKIGQIFVETGETLTSDSGFTYPEMAPIEGYHANLRAGRLLEEQEQKLSSIVIPAPATPKFVWA